MTFNPAEHISKVSGRDYLEVKWRIAWFRDAMPLGGIQTEIISTEPPLVRAIVLNEQGAIIATAHGSADDGGKNVVWKGRAVEKAETAAIGRALAHAGFGTQFVDDDEAGVVDSPVQRPAPQPQRQQQPAPSTNGNGDTLEFTATTCEVKEYSGKRYFVFSDGTNRATTYDTALAGEASQAVAASAAGNTIQINAAIRANLETKKDGGKYYRVAAIEPAGAAVPF